MNGQLKLIFHNYFSDSNFVAKERKKLNVKRNRKRRVKKVTKKWVAQKVEKCLFRVPECQVLDDERDLVPNFTIFKIFRNFTFLTDQTMERISSIKSHYRVSEISSESENRAQSREFIQSAREFKEASLAIKILEGRYLENDLSDRQIIQTQLEKHFQKVFQSSETLIVIADHERRITGNERSIKIIAKNVRFLIGYAILGSVRSFATYDHFWCTIVFIVVSFEAYDLSQLTIFL